MNDPAKKIDHVITALSGMIMRLRAYKKYAIEDTSPNAQAAWRAVGEACDFVESALEEMSDGVLKAKKEESPLSIVPG